MSQKALGGAGLAAAVLRQLVRHTDKTRQVEADRALLLVASSIVLHERGQSESIRECNAPGSAGVVVGRGRRVSACRGEKRPMRLYGRANGPWFGAGDSQAEAQLVPAEVDDAGSKARWAWNLWDAREG